MSEKGMVGAWNHWDFTPSKEAKAAFEQSLGKLLGVKYTLVASKSQLVNGTNYAFLCEAEVVAPAGADYIVEAQVYVPLKGNAVIHQIKTVGAKPGPGFGSWGNWDFTVSRRAMNVFKLATKDFFGASYKPLANATQLVAGMNYCFLCEMSPAIWHPTPSPVVVWISAPLQGNPHITGITSI
ncbi:MAG: hypothetical protein QE487_04965 [Fluviicola sp.]|nr:hypothetical protein [Fluviicola sp.]